MEDPRLVECVNYLEKACNDFENCLNDEFPKLKSNTNEESLWNVKYLVDGFFENKFLLDIFKNCLCDGKSFYEALEICNQKCISLKNTQKKINEKIQVIEKTFRVV